MLVNMLVNKPRTRRISGQYEINRHNHRNFVLDKANYLYYYTLECFLFLEDDVETSHPPTNVTAEGQPVKRAVVPRDPVKRTRRPRTAKRLFLLFCVVFLIIVYLLITEGN